MGLIERFCKTPITWFLALFLFPPVTLDVLLMRHHLPALSHWAGEHIVLSTASMVLLWFHFHAHRWETAERIAQRFDPIKAAGRLATR